ERLATLKDPDQIDSLPEITISILPNSDGLDLVAFTNKYDGGWFTHYLTNTTIVVDGKPGRRFSDIGAAVGHAPFEAVFVDVGPIVVLFTLNDYEGENRDVQLEVFNRILSLAEF